MSLAAAGLPPHSRVLVAAGDFTSATWPFATRGHELVEVPLDEVGSRAAEFDAVAVRSCSRWTGASSTSTLDTSSA